MPFLARPHLAVNTSWGEGVLDFQYSLTKCQQRRGALSQQGDLRVIFTPGLRATRHTSLRFSFCGVKSGQPPQPELPPGKITLKAEQTLGLLRTHMPELQEFVLTRRAGGKRSKGGVIRAADFAAFLTERGILPPAGQNAGSGPRGGVGRDRRGGVQASRKPSSSPSSLRASMSRKKSLGLQPFCTIASHDHAPGKQEDVVVDHVLELQLLHALNKDIGLPRAELRELANAASNLQELGSLQNRAKAWVTLKQLQRRRENLRPNTTYACVCVRCVARSLLPREHLRCAGSLRGLAHEGAFECLARSLARSWEAFLSALLQKGRDQEHDMFLESAQRLVNCSLTGGKNDPPDIMLQKKKANKNKGAGGLGVRQKKNRGRIRTPPPPDSA